MLVKASKSFHKKIRSYFISSCLWSCFCSLWFFMSVVRYLRLWLKGHHFNAFYFLQLWYNDNKQVLRSYAFLFPCIIFAWCKIFQTFLKIITLRIRRIILCDSLHKSLYYYFYFSYLPYACFLTLDYFSHAHTFLLFQCIPGVRISKLLATSCTIPEIFRCSCICLSVENFMF